MIVFTFEKKKEKLGAKGVNINAEPLEIEHAVKYDDAINFRKRKNNKHEGHSTVHKKIT